MCLLEIRCKNPGLIAYGSMPRNVVTSTTWAVGDKLEYSCDKYYEISGENPITCESNGQWSNVVPKCVGKC